MPANLDRHGIVDLVDVLGVLLQNRHVGRDDLAEIVENEPCKDFLLDILHPF